MSLVPVPTPPPNRANVIDLAEDYWKLAQKIAGTEFVPTPLRTRPEAVLAALLSGAERGLGPMESLRSMHVIEGRPSLSAEAMRALVFAAGHTIEIVESTSAKCTVIGRRYDSETTSPPFTWTMDRARRAKLTNKKNWLEYPEAMLLARATTDLCRALFPDVIAGFAATEELDEEPPRRVRTITRRKPEPEQTAAPEDQTGGEDAGAAPAPGDATESTGSAMPVLGGIPGADHPSWAPAPAPDPTLKKIHAQLRKALPDATKDDIDRYRHALALLASRKRPDGPVISSAALNDEETLRLSRFLVDVEAGRSTITDGPDGIEIRTTSNAKPWIVDVDRHTVAAPETDE